MAWPRIARERSEARRCCEPHSHTRKAGLQLSQPARRYGAATPARDITPVGAAGTSGAMAWCRNARRGCKARKFVRPCARARTAAKCADATGTVPVRRSVRPTHRTGKQVSTRLKPASGAMAWPARRKSRRCSKPFAHALRAAMQMITLATMAPAKPGRARRVSAAASFVREARPVDAAGPFSHPACCTIGDPIQHDGMALHRSQET